MGGLWKKMPVTWITALIGSLALIGVPFFSGFYSKDSIIIATHAAANAGQWGAPVAYWALTIGVFITAFYSFRMFFLVFHGKPRWLRNRMTPNITLMITLTSITASRTNPPTS